MGFKMPHIGVIVGLVCIGVALIFQIIGLATTGWSEIKAADYGVGLWKTCTGSKCDTYSTDNIPDWLNAVRAFGILGILAIGACLVAGILICFSENKILPMLAMIIAFVAAFCIMIEFAVYAGERNKTANVGFATDYGYSFALTIVAFVLCLAAGVCFLLPNILGGSP